jgi:hypothetical protein
VFAEFDKMYDRLPSADQQLLDGDKVLLFLKAVDAKDWSELGSHLEDEMQLNGLVVNWATVSHHLDKRQQ